MFIVNIVFAWEHAVARTTEKELGMIASHRFPMYKPIKDKVNLDFLMYFFLRKKGKHLLGLASPGGAGRNKTLGQQAFAKLKVNIPTLPEQQKIANFLSSVDKKIEQLRQKVSLLEDYKKGVMQQIFSQKIRFKDDNGEAFADWEVKRFGEIFSFIRTNSFSRNLLNYDSGEVKNIHYGDIHTKFKGLLDLSKEKVPYLNQEVDISKVAEEDYCQEGDLVIADASEDYADIGKSIEVVNLNNERLVAGLHTYIARSNTKMALGFKSYLMQCWDIRHKVMVIATGVSVLGISKTNLSKITIEFPCVKEQQKIANFLSSIDDKIQQSQQQLEKTKQFKKGLLQQLFV
ncbi:restriction endonuclease subunit S [Aureispira sp. CCB-E]|uniref:restriction endonuclease subunit S n=1 Tax=Aureispira sp. CCB-E TaxID=3051121 RepID=UPI0028686197|nr:restriction endonuclease subunit S [Aureispira sp. CCB-E]WMX16535.1 restriction endonuclease subunit S [Aureispira sp. CCB-E]